LDWTRLDAWAGSAILLAGLILTIASLTSVGEAQSWDVADAFAADSTRGVRRVGMLLAAVGLAALVAVTPILVARVAGSEGFAWVAAGWVGFAGGAVLFAMALGVTAIVMPSLGELARTGAISPQEVADQMTRQSPIVAAFLGGNLTFLSWVVIGVGLARSGLFPPWLGWFVGGAALATWLGFLHAPVFQRFGAPLWPVAVLVLGYHVLRLD
jgi:hypothetical protein